MYYLMTIPQGGGLVPTPIPTEGFKLLADAIDACDEMQRADSDHVYVVVQPTLPSRLIVRYPSRYADDD